MLVLTVFLSVCLIAVMFLLRFFFAIDSEIRSQRKRPAEEVTRAFTQRTPTSEEVRSAAAARAITLVYSRSRLAIGAHSASAGVFHQTKKSARLKEA